MLQFLEYLRHRLCNIKVEFINITSNDPDILRVTGDFLAERSVKKLHLIVRDMVSTKADL